MAIFLDHFLRPVFSASRVQHISDLHSKFALRPQNHTMCRSMVDIHSATAVIRREKNERKIEEETTGQKYNSLPYYIGQPYLCIVLK